MAKSRNRRKKHNPAASKSALIDRRVLRAVPSTLIAYCASEEGRYSRMFNRKGVKILPESAVANRMKTMQLPWTVVAVAICKDRDGQHYLKDVVIEPDEGEPRKHSYVDAIDGYEKNHRELIRGCNRDHICSFGWVSSPMGDAADPDLVMRIMGTLGGFESPAQWEINQMIERGELPAEVATDNELVDEALSENGDAQNA